MWHMKLNGLIVPVDMAEAPPARPDKSEVASTLDGRDITRGMINPMLLEMPDDSVLMQRGGGDYTLYKEMLRDDKVKPALEQRFAAVVARSWEVKPGGKRAIDKAAADFITEQLNALLFDNITGKMLYGVYYGHAVAEALWGEDGRFVTIANIKVRDRRRFGYDGAGRLRMRTLQDPNGELLPERKFWHFATGADHDDAPYGLGLAHWLYWPVWLKRNGLRFWSVFLEKFGTPTGIGWFPPGTSPADQSKLLSALRAIQRDSAIIMPDGMKAELLEAKRSGTADHAAFVQAMNDAITTIIIGQTASTHGTPGKLGNEDLQDQVRDDITKADADLVCMSFNRTIVRWLTEWNFPGAALPNVWRNMEDEEDLNKRAEREDKVQTWGYKPTLAHIKDIYGGDWEERQTPTPPNLPLSGEGQTGVAQTLPPDKGGSRGVSFSESHDFPDQTALDAALDKIDAGDLDAQVRALLRPILDKLSAGAKPEELLGWLAEAYPGMDGTALVETLTRLIFVSTLWGKLSVQDELHGA